MSRIQFKKLLPLVQRYDKEADLDIIYQVWSGRSEEHRQCIIDSLTILENKKDYEASLVAASFKNMSQYAKMTKEYRQQNEFIDVLGDANKSIGVDREGNLIVV